MVVSKHIHLPGFKVDLTLATSDGDAHSKVGDHPEVLDLLWVNIHRALDIASKTLDGFPHKEFRLAEGCK
jgi:hypothetical protein